MYRRCTLLVVAACGGARGKADAVASGDATRDAARGQLIAYVSGYSTEISRFDVSRATGGFGSAVTITSFAADPSFLAVDPHSTHLYAVSEATSRVGAYAIDPTNGALTSLNDVASGGNGPAHVFVDRSGAWVMVANYDSGHVATFAIATDGRVTAAHQVLLAGANAHQIITDPSNRFAFVPCLGSDWVAQYTFDPASGMLTPNSVPHLATQAGAGPRHMAFSPDGHFAYLLAEKSSTLSALAFDGATGRLTELQTLSTLPAGYSGRNTTAEVWVHPSGAFVYASNRGDDSIATFARNATTGQLSLVGHTKTGGATPRDFTLDPDGHYLYAANQGSGNIVTFAVDTAAGTLTPTGSPISAPAPSFVGIVTLPER